MVDNLYLDMNGIIHNCTHGNDPGTKLTEPEMIVKVFAYLEKLFEIVQPQQLLFMAVDGASPSSTTCFHAYSPVQYLRRSTSRSQQQLSLLCAGVAPRAKMNQQRSRRFKSSREAEEVT